MAPKTPKTLISIFLTSLLLICCSLTSYVLADEEDNLVALYSYGLHPPYIEENLSNTWWDFGGDTIVEVNKYPLTSSSWIIEFEFNVNGMGHMVGDGFAFWYTKDRATEGPVFGSGDEFTGLGIFFDTYSNGRHR
ncbi:hypothetical protein HDV05_002581, partial [Chytridiales sp. JEL 0842]